MFKICFYIRNLQNDGDGQNYIDVKDDGDVQDPGDAMNDGGPASKRKNTCEVLEHGQFLSFSHCFNYSNSEPPQLTQFKT